MKRRTLLAAAASLGAGGLTMGSRLGANLGLGLGLGLAGTGCHGVSARLRVGIHPWIGYESLFLAANFGWLPAGVELREGENATDSLRALDAGQADVACLTLDEVLRARADGLPLQVALIMDVSAGADAVLARAEISDLAQLAGARLGYESSALGGLVLGELLKQAGLSVADLTLVELPPDRQLAAWQAGEIDAVITYEPTLSRLEQAGMRRLFDSRDMPETIFDVLALRQGRSFAERRLLRQLIVAHFRALAHLQGNPQDAVYRMAANLALNPEEVRRSLAGVILPGLSANHAYLSGRDPVVMEAARMLSAQLLESGLIAQADTLERLLTADYLPGAESGK
jgi:NitT/TauT family transport system substrate-binding protein